MLMSVIKPCVTAADQGFKAKGNSPKHTYVIQRMSMTNVSFAKPIFDL